MVQAELLVQAAVQERQDQAEQPVLQVLVVVQELPVLQVCQVQVELLV